MIRRLLICLICFFLFSKSVFASNAVIINQIRGNEACCQPGSQELITAITDNPSVSNIPMGWAVRYDALDDLELAGLLKDVSGELGAFLEITPEFAKKSGVSYKGEENGYDWHFGKNVFLVGYTKDERKKLIDTYFQKFKSVFGAYPSFSVSWMIDSWSLEYLSKTYGVKLHEITKEQYETDSYTLYGGIFNAPYYSSTHPLIPSKDTGDSVVIIRQTISDPLQNYGFPKAYYTSQPNDYLSNDNEVKDISYFNNLVNSVTDQTTGFPLAVIGIENSFDFSKYGDEYIKQLIYLKSKQDERLLTIETPSNTARSFKNKFKRNPSFIIDTNFHIDSEFGSLWYFSPYYRVRVIVKGDEVILTDLRNYYLGNDPYEDKPLETDYGYLIAPYLFDGSQQFERNDEVKKKAETLHMLEGNVYPDSITNPYGIVLGKKPFTFKFDDNRATITFTGNNKGKVAFTPETINIDSSLSSYIRLSENYPIKSLFEINNKQIPIEKHFDFSISKDKDKVLLGYDNGSSKLTLFTLSNNGTEYSMTPYEFGDEIYEFSSQFQPDRSELNVDKEKSVFYWNNVSATVNRNPVRLFILPLNAIGRPTKVQSVNVSFSDNYGISTVYPEDYSFRVSPWFIDISSSKPLVTQVSVTIDGKEVISNKTLYFLPNCKENPLSCLTSCKVVIQYITDRLSQIPAKLFTASK